MTIVLQHQFWDLEVDEEWECHAWGSRSGGCEPPGVPFDALIAFADPHVRFGLRFRRRPRADARPRRPPEPSESRAGAPSAAASAEATASQPSVNPTPCADAQDETVSARRHPRAIAP